MRKLFISCLLFATTLFAADFERSNWRTQIYLQGEPAFLNFEDKNQGASLLDKPINKDLLTIPASAGFLWSPLITPFAKADIPLTIWLGLEINSVQFGTIGKTPKFSYEKTKGDVISCEANNVCSDREFSFLTYAPSVVGGLSFNLGGNFDLRALGGYGFQIFTFYDEYLGHTNDRSTSKPTAFVSGALEYRITEVFQDVDLKVGINVRKEFLPFEDVKASDPVTDQQKNEGVPSGWSGITFDKIQYKWPVRVGLEVSLDFGRESRRDRRMRFTLRDRDAVLRNNSEVKDTLSDWDCMAIERDYRFFLDEDGNLPDMSEAYTRTQFSDVLESYLAFCHPADLATKEQLYATLDSGKVELQEYQVKQEDSRFEQVMASNDPEMLEMFLQYYPASEHRAEVEAKLNALGEYHKFREIQAQNTFKAYLTYLNDNPSGAFRDEAEAGIFELVKAGNRMKDYEIYLKRFPDGKYVEEAKAALRGANTFEDSMIEEQAGVQQEPDYVNEVSAEADEEEEEEVVKPKKGKKKPAAKAKKKEKKAKKAPSKKAKGKKKK